MSGRFLGDIMKCEIVKALLENQIAIYAVKTDSLVNSAIKKHNLSPVAAAALGRMLTATALMGASLKNSSDYLTATIKGDGQLGSLVCCADGRGLVKGYVDNPTVDNDVKEDGHLNVGKAVGKNGMLTVIKNIGLKTPYVGTSRLVSGEIAEDFAQYFVVSEQQPCSVALGVKLQKGKCLSAGGVIVQVLPNCDPQLLFDVETVCYAMDEISYQFESQNAKQVIERFFSQLGNLEFEPSKYCSYRCDCSTKRIERVVLSLGIEEALNVVEEMGCLEIGCHFCGKKYRYDKEQIIQLFQSAQK